MSDKIKAKCTAITQREKVGQVVLTLLNKEKKPDIVVTINYDDPERAAAYKLNALYTFTTEEAK